jgi:hypothetical protein
LGLRAARDGLFALLLATTWVEPAVAAEVQEEALENGVALISIVGEIKFGDEEKFRELSLKNPKAIVALDSPGGSLIPGLEIGRMINLRGYRTVVLDKTLCASACALIWLGGIPRYLEPGGVLGFHASYRTVDGKMIESGVANALIGHYFSQLNLSENAVVFATSAPPDKIMVLNDENRLDSGIQFETLRLDEFSSSGKNSPERTPHPKGPRRVTSCSQIQSGTCLPSLTRLVVRIESELGSRTSTSGEVFRITLAEPVVIDGKTLLPAGLRGQGEVIHAKGTGFGARGELVIAARFLEVGGQKLPLRSMQVGDDSKVPQGSGGARDLATGLPIGFIRGQQIEIPDGTLAIVKTAEPYVIDMPETKPGDQGPASPSKANPQ